MIFSARVLDYCKQRDPIPTSAHTKKFKTHVAFASNLIVFNDHPHSVIREDAKRSEPLIINSLGNTEAIPLAKELEVANDDLGQVW